MEKYYLIKVKGVVQGVGFRPFVYREAKKRGIKGYVKNTGSGVEILCNKKKFAEIFLNPPPLARIYSVDIKKINDDDIKNKTYDDFLILKSSDDKGETILPPDIFTCDNCIKELRDKNDRRYGYYFITCTDCGPRFSMIEDYPYDRPTTSMEDFEMCERCKKEYKDPMDRRYHAQTIACHSCGPKLRLLDISKEGEKNDISGKDDKSTIKKAAELLDKGMILAIKGVGGFHLASKADDATVKKMRDMLGRANKPFAMMVKDLEMLKKIATCTKLEKKILLSPARPIVAVKKSKEDSYKEVSELDTLGIMMPYTALHYMLFDFLKEPLVMTSANIPGEPVLTEEKIARFFLTHDRRIVNRCDDSVIKVIEERPFFLRRSRGYAPMPITLGTGCKDTIALGAELNNVICAAKGNNAFLSQHIGDTSKLKTFEFLKETTEKMIRLTRLKPKIIACDMHPGYNTSGYAKELAKRFDAKLIKIQHHKAHLASVAAEHGLSDYIGIACDGIGFGEDGHIWGGEVFEIKNHTDFRRIGHLQMQPMIGGDAATLRPKKMLLGILAGFLDEQKIKDLELFGDEEIHVGLKQLEQGFNTFWTSSTGRVLDAASALLGLCERATYEGRPAMLLESHATLPFALEEVIEEKDGEKILMTTPLFEFLIKNIEKDKGRLAATAQQYIAKGLYAIALASSSSKEKKIVFSGGVAYNKDITSFMLKKEVLMNNDVPQGDGCICFGQSYLANMIAGKEKR